MIELVGFLASVAIAVLAAFKLGSIFETWREERRRRQRSRMIDDAIDALTEVHDLVEAGHYKEAADAAWRSLDELEHNNLDVPDVYKPREVA